MKNFQNFAMHNQAYAEWYWVMWVAGGVLLAALVAAWWAGRKPKPKTKARRRRSWAFDRNAEGDYECRYANRDDK
tara:strand:+ start:326 stop:550 length:225 start_codon:yes stop_codon:yes gene_type:complete